MSESGLPSNPNFVDLHRKAEAQLQQQSAASPEQVLANLSPEQIERLVHELQVHQIELEMQNEELRRTQQELEAARDQYTELYDFAPIGYLTVDEKGMILTANLTIARQLGLDRASIIRRPLSQFVIAEDQDAYYFFQRRLVGSLQTQVIELRLARQNASHFYARLEAILRGTAEAAAYWIAISDVTEHKLTEQYALRTERLAAMGNLATTLAHEIKNPLHALRLSMDLVLDKALNAEQHEFCLNLCDKEIERLITVSQKVLDFARPERTTTHEVTTVENLINDTLALVDELVRKANVQVIADVPSALPNLQAPQDQIMQILINVILNAIEAMPDGGWIHITTEVTPDTLCLRLANKGPLIPAETLAHVFEPYFTTKPHGTGLGLSVSRNIVRELNGELDLANLSDGEGVVVSLTLPIANHGAA